MMKKQFLAVLLLLSVFTLSVFADGNDGTLDVLNNTLTSNITSTGVNSFSISLNSTQNLTNVDFNLENAPAGISLVDVTAFNLTENLTISKSFSLNITPSSSLVGVQTFLLNATDGNNWDTVTLNLNITEISTFNIVYTDMPSKLGPGENATGNVTITNTGTVAQNYTISKLAFEDSYSEDITLKFNDTTATSFTTSTVQPNEQVSFSYLYESEEDQEMIFDSDMGYDITVTNDQGTTNSFELKTELASDILDVGSLSGFDNNYEPGEIVSFEISKIENTWENASGEEIDMDLKDVEIRLIDINKSNGDLVIDEDYGYLGYGEELTDLSFEFTIPYNVEEGTYDILFIFSGDSDDEDVDDEEVEDIKVIYKNKVEVDKSSNDAHIELTSVSSFECGNAAVLNGLLINTGSNSLYDLEIRLSISDSNISDSYLVDELKKNTYNTREEEFSFLLNIPTTELEGTHTLTMKAYADYDTDEDLVAHNNFLVEFTGSCIEVEDESSEDDNSVVDDDSEDSNVVYLPTGFNVLDWVTGENANLTFWVMGDLVLLLVGIYFLRLIFKSRR